jgi:hypothetical protein
MFFAALICTTALSVLLFTLLYTHFADKDRLAAEVRRMTPWFRVLSVVIGLIAWVMAVMVAANHTVLAVVLILMGTKFGVMVLTLKSTMDRRILSSRDLT